MNQTIKYPTFVKNVYSKKQKGINRRLCLTIILKNNNSDIASVIMMNPSKATKNESDSTINRVINYISKNPSLQNIGTIKILNLYTIYETYSSSLVNLVNKYGYQYCAGNDKFNQNDRAIYKSIRKSNKIIIAWGKPKLSKTNLALINYDDRIKSICKILESKKGSVFKLGSSMVDGKYPRHPSRISYREVITLHE